MNFDDEVVGMFYLTKRFAILILKTSLGMLSVSNVLFAPMLTSRPY